MKTPASTPPAVTNVDYSLSSDSNGQLRACVRLGERTESGSLAPGDFEAVLAHWETLPGTPTRDQGLDVGVALFDLAFGWSQLARQTCDAGPVDLRLRLDPCVTGLPWELLAASRRAFLALRFGARIVRRADAIPLATPDRWRVLVACAALDGAEAGMRQELQDILDVRALDVDVQATTSIAALQRRLSSAVREGRPYHVLHLAAHGARAGELLLEGASGTAGQAVSAESLADILLAASPLHAVVTTACWGGTPVGLASALAERGVPEVVGLSRQTLVEDALTFARGFYDALPGQALAAAVAAGRQALLGAALETVAWAQVVHHSSGDEVTLGSAHQSHSQPLPPDEPSKDEQRASGNTVIVTRSKVNGGVAGGNINLVRR